MRMLSEHYSEHITNQDMQKLHSFTVEREKDKEHVQKSVSAHHSFMREKKHLVSTVNKNV